MRDGGSTRRWSTGPCCGRCAQKEELGLLDATFEDEPPATVDLDGPEHRGVAARLAEESVVLLGNDGTLPLEQPAPRWP